MDIGGGVRENEGGRDMTERALDYVGMKVYRLSKWVSELGFWKRLTYIFFSLWFIMSVISFFARKGTNMSDIFVCFYLFCMYGALISLIINIIWENITERVELKEEITRLEDELRKYKKGG